MDKVEFFKEAHEELNRIDPIWKKRIKLKLKLIVENPDSLKKNIKKLKDKLNNYNSLRLGNYNVIFSFEQGKMIILILRNGHRKEINPSGKI
mgnify:CR=1 FL=1